MIIDMHSDTLYELEKHPEKELRHNDLMIDLEKMRRSDYLIQNFGIYTDLNAPGDPLDHVMRCIDVFYREMDKNKDLIGPVLNTEDIENNARQGRMSALLTLEEGDVIHGDLAILRDYYRLGVRMIALSHNLDNHLTHPHTSSQGLTELGRAYIREMDRLGIIIDVSHMSDACFYEILALTDKPFVASHSNARGVAHHSRNLSDDMILRLAERDGVMGINFYAPFLSDNAHVSRVDDMIQQIMYIRDLAGIDVIALGSDFDGIDCPLEMKNAGELYKLKDALIEAGFDDEEIDKIFYQNALRVYKDVLG